MTVNVFSKVPFSRCLRTMVLTICLVFTTGRWEQCLVASDGNDVELLLTPRQLHSDCLSHSCYIESVRCSKSSFGTMVPAHVEIPVMGVFFADLVHALNPSSHVFSSKQMHYFKYAMDASVSSALNTTDGATARELSSKSHLELKPFGKNMQTSPKSSTHSSSKGAHSVPSTAAASWSGVRSILPKRLSRKLTLFRRSFSRIVLSNFRATVATRSNADAQLPKG